MLIGSSRKLNSIDPVSIDISGECLKACNSFKYLGVIINYYLTWDDHVNYISKQILKKLSLFRRIKAYLPVSTRVLLFNSFILLLFGYCDVVWGDRGNSTLMQYLQVLHNKSAREILDLPYFSSATNALTKLGWITLDRRRSRHRVNLVYKCINGLT